MRTIVKTITLFILAGAVLSGCEKIKSLVDVKFNTDLSADLGVTIPSYNMKAAVLEGFEFSESATIDIRSDSEIDKYFDKLKSFDVQELTGTVKSVSKPVTIISGTLSITSGSTVASWSVSDFDVVVGSQIVLDNGDGQWDKVNKILDAKKEFTVKIVGLTDTDDVTFVIEVVIKVKVTANPL